MNKRLIQVLLSTLFLTGISLSAPVWAASEIAVKVEVAGKGAVSLSPAAITSDSQTKTYLYGTTTSLTATATPDPGFVFDRWSGTMSSTSNPISVSLSGEDPSAPFVLQAQFKKSDMVPGIALLQADSADTTGKTLLISSSDLGPAVADMDHNGVVDANDAALFNKCGNGFGNQPTGYDLPDPGWANPTDSGGGVFVPDPDLRRCAEADLDGDGDVDGSDLEIFNSCLADPNHPLSGYACFGAAPASGVAKTWVEISGPLGIHFSLSSSGGSPITQNITFPGHYTVKTAVIDTNGGGCRNGTNCISNISDVSDAAWRVSDIFMPMVVKLTLRVDANADEAGTVSADKTGFDVDTGDPCTITGVSLAEKTCAFLIDEQIGIHAAPNDSLGYQFVQWQAYGDGDAPNDLQQTNKDHTVTLTWTNSCEGYKLRAVIAPKEGT